MPLLETKPFALAEAPKDVEPHKLVYQVRFTNEIFSTYREYLKRMNLYRQRVWRCKVTGKINLTYEEALVSEKLAADKFQKFPNELKEIALRIIQFSMLSLKSLANTVSTKLQERLYPGAIMIGKKDGDVFPCKIVKVLERAKKIQYEVEWFDRNKDTAETGIVNKEDLVQKKFPYSTKYLKSFIRESTYRNSPWVVHDELALKHGISTDPPKELRNIVSFENGLVVRCSKKRKKEDNTYSREGDQTNESTTYPIDDLLVQPGADDPVFTDRPSPSGDFIVPAVSVGDLLVVWDFCYFFGRLLHLWPFSLEDFENAICHKDNNSVLIVESHMALLQLLINDNSEYFSTIQERKRKLRVTAMKWTEYLCDFIDMIKIPELRAYTSIIKRGHYGLLDSHAKLRILSELVNQALETAILRKNLDECVEKQLALGATRREEALEEGRKRREEKERLKIASDVNEVLMECNPGQNGDVVNKESDDDFVSQSDKKQLDTTSDKKKQKTENKIQNVEDQSSNGAKVEETKQLNGDNDDKEEARGKSSKERRKHYEREMEKLFVRTNPLGKDRNYNRYWWFRDGGRIFVESSDSKKWSYYRTKEELDALIGSLNCKGEREKALHEQLAKLYRRIGSELQKRSKELSREIERENAILRRSTRVRAPLKENLATAFMRYHNKWKEN